MGFADATSDWILSLLVHLLFGLILVLKPHFLNSKMQQQIIPISELQSVSVVSASLSRRQKLRKSASVSKSLPATSVEKDVETVKQDEAGSKDLRTIDNIGELLQVPGNRNPEYPRLSRLRGEQGRVLLEVILSGANQVEKVMIVESSGFLRLDEAAVFAVKSWVFPANSKQRWLLPFRFSLSEKHETTSM